MKTTSFFIVVAIAITMTSCNKNDVIVTESQKIDTVTTAMILKWISSKVLNESPKNIDKLVSLISWDNGKLSRLKNGTYIAQIPLKGGLNNTSINFFMKMVNKKLILDI